MVRSSEASTPAAALHAIVRAQSDIARAAHDSALVMQLAVEHALALTGAVGAAVERLEGGELVVACAGGTLAGTVGRRTALSDSFAGHAIRSGSAASEVGGADDGSLVAIPLPRDSGAAGVLLLSHGDEHWFDSTRVHSAELLATLVAVCLPDAQEEQVGQAERLHRSAVTVLPEGVLVLDRQLAILTANAAASRILGWPVSWMEGNAAFDSQLGALAPTGEPLLPEAHPAAVALRTGESQRDAVLGVRSHEGTLRWLAVSAEPLLNAAGEVVQVVVSFGALTSRQGHGARADHDMLTGLATHQRIVSDLAAALARARRSGRGVGLVCVDLEDFCDLNARCGHESADRVLFEAGARVSHTLRAGELCARYGDDEFAVLSPDLDAGASGDARRALDLVAERLCETLRRPFALEGRSVALGVSAGTALFPHDACDLDGMLSQLDQTLNA